MHLISVALILLLYIELTVCYSTVDCVKFGPIRLDKLIGNRICGDFKVLKLIGKGA